MSKFQIGDIIKLKDTKFWTQKTFEVMSYIDNMWELRDIDDGSQLHKGYTEHELVQVGKFNSR